MMEKHQRFLNSVPRILTQTLDRVRLQLHGAIYRPDSFVLMLRYCANLKAIRYESRSLNRIVADKSHCLIVALRSMFGLMEEALTYTLTPNS